MSLAFFRKFQIYFDLINDRLSKLIQFFQHSNCAFLFFALKRVELFVGNQYHIHPSTMLCVQTYLRIKRQKLIFQNNLRFSV